MPLQPEPIFFRSLKRGTGSKRKLITIANTDPAPFGAVIRDVEKPEWLELEQLVPGKRLDIAAGRKLAVVVNVNTDHRFFPTEPLLGEAIRVSLEGADPLAITVSIQEVQEGMTEFRGVLAVDFGTSNSCFAWKPRYDERADAEAPFRAAVPSDEVPSIIFFTDVSTADRPAYLVGTEAARMVHEHAGQTWSYLQSVKRLVGRQEKFLVLDAQSGSLPDHRQMWTAEEVGAFVVRDMIRRAEAGIGQRVTQVVATYPTLYSAAQRDAVRTMFESALKGLGRPVAGDTVTLGLDEATACAFNYLYNVVLPDFRQFAEGQKVLDLLAFDFGGGTIDVVLLRATLRREDAVRISIHTDVRGVTGELHYGGDNVTLDVFRALKVRLAGLAAALRHEAAEKAAAEAAAKKKGKKGGGSAFGDDPFAGGGGGGAGDDPFATSAPTTDATPAAAVEAEDPDLADITRLDPEDVLEAAAREVWEAREALDRSAATGIPLEKVLAEADKARGLTPAPDDARRRAEALERAVERLLPTKFGVYEDEDPIRADLARRLFHELWQEADLLKVRVSRSADRARVETDLKRVARYTGIPAERLADVGLTLPELEARIRPKIERAVRRSAGLWQEAAATAVGGLVVAGQGPKVPLKVLLAGNSSNLAIVRRLVSEIFRIPDTEIVRNPGGLKAAVAQGAAEEHALRRDFGGSGLIAYRTTGLADRVPWAIGLFHPTLEGVGFRGGFCPIFERGTPVGAEVVVQEGANPLVYKGMPDLGVYASYRDGSAPTYVGFVDLKATAPPPPVAAPAKGTLKPIAGVGGGEAKSAQEVRFGLKLKLLPDRTIEASDAQSGQRYPFVAAKEHWAPEDYPFSGVH